MNRIARYLQPTLVSFAASWQPGCQLIFRDRTLALSDEEVLRRFSWTVDTQCSRSHLAGKTFYGERYGGSGIGVHGGGARCGFDGEGYQLKGMGPNPLLGVIGEDDIGQSDGELTLSSALYEMIWSRILDTVLPFGANRCLAIFAVPERNAFCRALLLRDSYLRPAHFERAAYFRGGAQGGRHEQAKDVRRTADMCRQLPDILATTFRLRGDAQRCVTDGLCEFARRQAAQIACATSRFLYHSVSSSNFSLDGKWHDFTALSPLDPHNLPVGKGLESSWCALWQQFAIVADVLASWIFHYAKYTHLSRALAQGLLREVLTEFEDALNHHYAQNLLCMMGIPPVIAKMIYTENAVQAWTTSLLAILPSLPFWLQRADEALQLNALSFSHTASMANSTAFFQQTQVANWVLQRETVRRRVLAVAQDLGITAVNLSLAIDINAAKFLFPRRETSWTAMTDYLDEVIAQKELTLSARLDILLPWCEERIAQWRFHLDAEEGMQTTCWQDKTLCIVFDMQDGKFIVSAGGRASRLSPPELHAYVNTGAVGHAFNDYCEQSHLSLFSGR